MSKRYNSILLRDATWSGLIERVELLFELHGSIFLKSIWKRARVLLKRICCFQEIRDSEEELEITDSDIIYFSEARLPLRVLRSTTEAPDSKKLRYPSEL